MNHHTRYPSLVLGQPPRYLARSRRTWQTWEPWLTYAIRSSVTGYIKIGKCLPGREYARFKSAEKLIGEPCDWLGYLAVDETTAHHAMRPFWVWREWFEPTDAFIDYIIPLLRDDPPRARR